MPDPSVTAKKRGAVANSPDGPERGIQTRNCRAISFVPRVVGKPDVVSRRSVTAKKCEAASKAACAASSGAYAPSPDSEPVMKELKDNMYGLM